MVKLDLKDAYFTVLVWKGHQKFLRFIWKETLWEFACLPFGLASAPRTFTKIRKPVQRIEFLGLSVDSVTLCLALPRDKVRSICRECEGLIANPVATVRQLAYLLGRLSSSIQAVFPAPLYYRYLQQAKIQALHSGGHYEFQVFLNQEAIEELQWWAENLMAWNGRALAHPDPSMIIESDTSMEG